MKCGVMVLDIVRDTEVQINLFTGPADDKKKAIHQSMDKLNILFGKDAVRFAIQGCDKKYRLKTDYLSKQFTTNINQILEIK